jgi:hypothetical protein
VTPPRMLEAELQTQVLERANVYRYLSYHTYDSRRSAPGFPDLVLLHPDTGALIVAELKREDGTVTPEQNAWLRAFALRGLAYVWRPSDMRRGDVERALRRGAGLAR